MSSTAGASETMTAASPPSAGAPLLSVERLRVAFLSRGRTVNAVNSVSFSLERGESLAILGESGSGKSVTAKSLLGLIDRQSAELDGVISLSGVDIARMTESQLRSIRGRRIALISQDSLDSLNPVYSVGEQLSEVLRVRLDLSRAAARERALELMNAVKIPDPAANYRAYPHQYSGGMRQRACIAMAIALEPALLVADEPTTALDVTVQSEILKLLNELRSRSGMGLIFITHDLGVARIVANRVLVMYAGEVVEDGPIESVYEAPAHPYTRALLLSHPAAVSSWRELAPIPAAPVTAADAGSDGCAFASRCSLVQDVCRREKPELRALGDVVSSRCHFAEEVMDGAAFR